MRILIFGGCGRQVLKCRLRGGTIDGEFAWKTIACAANLTAVTAVGGKFNGIKVARGNTVVFDGCDLRNSSWMSTDTMRVRFRDTNLLGSTLKVGQLAKALEVDEKCTLPHGITHADIKAERQRIERSGSAAVVKKLRAVAAEVNPT